MIIEISLLSLLLIVFLVFGYIVIQFLTFANSQWEQNKHVISTVFSLMANQQETLLNRIGYLQDIVIRMEPEKAHVVNNVPIPPKQEEPPLRMMDLDVADDIPVELIKDVMNFER